MESTRVVTPQETEEPRPGDAECLACGGPMWAHEAISGRCRDCAEGDHTGPPAMDPENFRRWFDARQGEVAS